MCKLGFLPIAEISVTAKKAFGNGGAAGESKSASIPAPGLWVWQQGFLSSIFVNGQNTDLKSRL